MASLLEQTRAAHEEVERLERLACLELGTDTRTQKARLLQTGRVRAMVDGIRERSAKLVRLNFYLHKFLGHLVCTPGGSLRRCPCAS